MKTETGAVKLFKFMAHQPKLSDWGSLCLLQSVASNMLVRDNKWVLIGCLTSPISTVNANTYPTSNFTCRKSFKFLSVSFRSLVLSPDAYRSCSIFLLSKYTPNTNIRLSFPLVYNGSLRK